ncbi:MAG: transporter [Devosia sp.]|nr:transporter [Devosia sp.]
MIPRNKVSENANIGRLAAVLVPGGLIALLNTTVVGVSIPYIVADLHTDVASAQWVTTAYMLAAGIAIPLGGWASVRFGIRRTWLVAMALFTLGSLAATLMPNVIGLALARIVQGAGAGALEPLMLTVLAHAATPARMGRILGSVSAVMSIGPLAGPALGGAIIATLGWRWIYLLSALVGLALLARAWFVLDDLARKPSRLDAFGLVLVTLATGLGLFGLSRAAAPSGFDSITMVPLVLAALALATLVWWAARLGENAIINLRTFAAPGFAPAIVIMTMMGAAVFPLFFGLPQFYQGVVGLDPATAGLLMIPYGIGNLVAMPLAGWLSDRFDATRIVWAGAAATLAGFALLLISGPTTSIAMFAGLSLLIGVGLGSVGSPTVSAMYRALPAALVASGSTILFMVLQLGGALGVASLVLLMGGHAWTLAIGSTPFWVPVAAALAIAIAGRFLSRNGSGSPAAVDKRQTAIDR